MPKLTACKLAAGRIRCGPWIGAGPQNELGETLRTTNCVEMSMAIHQFLDLDDEMVVCGLKPFQ